MIELTWRRANVSQYIDYKRDGFEMTTTKNVKDEVLPTYTFKKRVGTSVLVVREHYIGIVVNQDYRIRTENGPDMTIMNAAYLRSLQWTIIRSDKTEHNHRDDGPSSLYFGSNREIILVGWGVNGIDITDEVNRWLDETDLPPFYAWNDGHKALFKLRFGGVGYQP